MKRSLAQKDPRQNTPQGARRSFFESENTRLRLENARLNEELRRAHQRQAQSDARIRRLEQELEQTKERLAKVEEDLAVTTERAVTAEKQLKQAREQIKANSNNSHKPPSSDGPATTPEPKTKSSAEQDKKKKKPKDAHARKLVKPDTTEEVKPTCCKRCAQALSGEDSNPARHQVVEIPPLVAQVHEWRLHALVCEKCGTKTQAVLPKDAPRGAFGPRLTALCMYLVGALNVSRRQVIGLMEGLGCKMSLGALVDMQHATTAALKQPYDLAVQTVQAAKRVNGDETSWKEKGKKRWLWIAVCASATVFMLQARRTIEAARQLLGVAGEERVITTDRFGSYNWWEAERRQYCWAHLKREFKAMRENADAIGVRVGMTVLKLIRIMFKWWRKHKGGKMSHYLMAQKIQIRIMPKVQEALEEGQNSTHDKSAGTCASLLRDWISLWTFTRYKGVEPTNNEAERPIRPAVMWRKRSGGTQNERGGQFVERMLSCAATLKRRGVCVLAYLTALIQAAAAKLPAPNFLTFALPNPL